MNLSVRIPLLVAASVLLGASAVAGLCAWQAKVSLERQAEQHFGVLREARAGIVQGYGRRIEDQLQTIAHLAPTRDALSELVSAIGLIGAEADEARRDLLHLSLRDGGERIVDPDLDRRTGAYRTARLRYDPLFSAMAAGFGIDDVLLVSEAGQVVYSAKGSPLLGAELTALDAQGEPVGRLVREMLRRLDGQKIVYSDLSAGPTARDPPRTLAALPVLRPGPRSGDGANAADLQGFVLFTLAAEPLSEMLQAAEGLGQSGDAYLVDPDMVMRTQPRFIADAAGRRRIDAPGLKAALTGETGVMVQDDRRGTPVLSAYGPVEIFGSRWALIAAIDREEVVAPTRQAILQMGLATAAVLALAAILAAAVGGGIARPIVRMSEALAGLAELPPGDADPGGLAVPRAGARAPEIRRIHESFQSLIDSFRSRIDAAASGERQVQAELTLAENEARRQAELVDIILGSTSDAICVVDEDLRVVCLNTRYATLDQRPAHLIQPGESIEALVRYDIEQNRPWAEDPESATEARMAELYEKRDLSTELQTSDGRTFDMTQTRTPDRGLVFVLREVSHLKQTKRQLAEAEAAADAAAKAKSSFLTNMSHEIRTPVNAILGMARLAMRTDLDERQRDYLAKTQSAANYLLEIINDLLDFSKIEGGRIDIESVPFDIDQVFDRLAKAIGTRAREKGLQLRFAIEPDVPMNLIGDPTRLQQVLSNLGNNAVKFAEAGEITVGAKVIGRTDRHVRLELWVTDSGIGMTAEQVSQLFQPFTQADASTTRKYGGTGLGLTICKRIVELMDGKIWVESKPGGGSTFRFQVSFELADENAKLLLPANLTFGSSVLVVDDKGGSRQVLAEILASFGFKATLARSGEEALGLLSNESFDVVTLDWGLEGIDGIEAARQITASQPDTRPHLIMITDRDDDGLRAAAREAGIDAFLVKPVTSSMVLDAIMEAVGLTAAPSRRRVRKPANAEDIRFEGVRALVVEDNIVNQQVAREVLEHHGIAVTIAENGKAGLAAARTDRFDIVLTDIQMPEMDGFQLVAALKADPACAGLPVIAMTANALEGDRAAGLAAGMDDYITKPIDFDELLTALSRWVDPSRIKVLAPSQDRSSTGAAQAEPPAGDPLLSLAGIDARAAMRRLGGKRDLYRRFLEDFQRDQADAASEISAAESCGDRDAVARLAHTLKGVAGNLSVDGVYGAAKAVEHAVMASAGVSEMAAAIGELDRVLKAALAELATIAAAETVAVEASDEAARAALDESDLESLRGLRSLLEQRNLRAMTAVSELASGLSGKVAADRWSELEAAIGRLDYDAATAILDGVLDDAANPPPAPEKRPTGGFGEVVFDADLDQLSTLLDRHNLKADALAGEIAGRLDGHPDATRFASILAMIRRLDFKAASSTVAALRSEIAGTGS